MLYLVFVIKVTSRTTMSQPNFSAENKPKEAKKIKETNITNEKFGMLKIIIPVLSNRRFYAKLF